MSAVHFTSHVDGALAAAALGRRDLWLDMRPLGIGEVAWITQLVTVVAWRFSVVHSHRNRA